MVRGAQVLKSSLQLVLATILLFLDTQHSVSQEQKSGNFRDAAIFQNLPPKQKRVFAVAVSTNSTRVDLAKVDCLSLDSNWAHVDQVDHSDDNDMRKAVANHLKAQGPNDMPCRFLIRWTVIHEKTLAVRYRGHPSETLMSFSICEKPLNGPAGLRCLSKNVWLFDKITPAADEYTLGIKAFALSSNAKWVVVSVSLNN
jgi:hypothetical protein